MTSALLWLFVFYIRSLGARITLGNLTKKRPNGSILFVSYFPSVDTKALEDGRFLNKYAIPLQDKLNQIGKKIIWIFLYVNIDGWSFRDAVKITKRIKGFDENALLLHEFFTFRSFINVLKIWAGQLISYKKLSALLTDDDLTKGLTFKESYPLMLPIFRRSFCGRNSMEGLIYFEVFQGLFKYSKGISKCIYYAEMQAWERALNSAKSIFSPETQTIGFQHTSLSENYFHYFFDGSERDSNKSVQGLPLPDVFASNGSVPYTLLSRSEYPNLISLESVRQLYLNHLIDVQKPKQSDELILLVAGTIFEKETRALISLVMNTFSNKNRPFKIWLRGHPSMPMREVLLSMGIEAEKSNIEVMENAGQSIHDLLNDASIVITATSTIGIEALAFGCEVIVPVFCDFLCMSPLIGFETFYHRAYGPKDLAEKVSLVFSGRNQTVSNGEKLAFIKDYWSLDPSLDGWMNVLGIKC